ncbi:hypothetical protein EDC04DRAFT_3091085, partial [Pisolithus marmoratus]
MATGSLQHWSFEQSRNPYPHNSKNQAKQHPVFRDLCVSLAQRMHTAEVSPPYEHPGRTRAGHIAIENGANALAEGFLFAVAAALIVGESFRTSRAQSKRRDDVDDRLDELATSISSLRDAVEQLRQAQQELEGERERNDELQRVMERVVEIGLRGGWVEFEDTPLKVPK